MKNFNNPRISVIVPIYNTEKYLAKCIKSILNQTYKNFELLLIIDGSPDMSLEICEKFEEKDNRIIIINKANEGLEKTRRVGIL
ncbi:glycosyltransferase family A protein, partial [Flavobacterium sp.]